ncbi:hypothetical protein GS399_09080 [Pedobacter sp. HMF7647]|uniref:TraB/GumN family protein n=1 Tax=Hufsiella arboris TaxID=2695275 RepID=A0A7K1Y9L9_9SPHI|nr:TraB/GumN family protein [Hufsiella arboris]MXV51120.1 hypothetical protein [Hufsiella arboris]
MKRFLTLIFFSLNAYATVYGQSNGSLLWQISGNKLTKASYLFGTYHLIGKDFIDTLPGVMNSFNKCEMVAGEIITEDQILMAQKMMPYIMANDSTLDKVLNPMEYRKLDHYIHDKTGAAASAYNFFKPAMVQYTLLVMSSPKTISDTNPPLDIYFQDHARQQNKTTVGFETLDEQAKLLFNSPITKQKDDLMRYIADSAKNDSAATQLFKSYQQQDIPKLEKLLADEDDMSPEDRTKLLSARNKKWMPKILNLLNNHSVFIAVGAGHLFGTDGLIELLQQKGYRVTPVNTK